MLLSLAQHVYGLSDSVEMRPACCNLPQKVCGPDEHGTMSRLLQHLVQHVCGPNERRDTSCRASSWLVFTEQGLLNTFLDRTSVAMRPAAPIHDWSSQPEGLQSAHPSERPAQTTRAPPWGGAAAADSLNYPRES